MLELRERGEGYLRRLMPRMDDLEKIRENHSKLNLWSKFLASPEGIRALRIMLDVASEVNSLASLAAIRLVQFLLFFEINTNSEFTCAELWMLELNAENAAKILKGDSCENGLLGNPTKLSSIVALFGTSVRQIEEVDLATFPLGCTVMTYSTNMLLAFRSLQMSSLKLLTWHNETGYMNISKSTVEQVLFALNQTLLQHESLRAGSLQAPYTTEDLIKHYNCGDLNAVIFNHDTSQVIRSCRIKVNLSISCPSSEPMVEVTVMNWKQVKKLNVTEGRRSIYPDTYIGVSGQRVKMMMKSIQIERSRLSSQYLDFPKVSQVIRDQVPNFINTTLPPHEQVTAQEIDSYFRQELIYKRNERMGKRVMSLLRENRDKSFFFAFGAGIAGAKGLGDRENIPPEAEPCLVASQQGAVLCGYCPGEDLNNLHVGTEATPWSQQIWQVRHPDPVLISGATDITSTVHQWVVSVEQEVGDQEIELGKPTKEKKRVN
ncbi:hypothetical protein WISP_139999 [Willisornis vidua]|uniref:Metalloprotease TIKI n=1 Tax=Willisornis vidua TaxID=1566151 RepID=A0ABQ9CRX8_9PASS|nr:hypothetical protein WISP_139999 [Willisornis vidua]